MNTNEKKEITIRIAKEEDAEELLAIYAPYIEYTVITYEYDVPTVEEFRGRIRHVLERYPYLVADVNGEICGYAIHAFIFNTFCRFNIFSSMSYNFVPIPLPFLF